MFFVLAVSCTENTVTNCECVNPLLDSSATVVISYVTDGDTYKFGIKSDTVTIRLLHVDCYEVRNTQRLRDQADAKGISVDSALALGYAGRDFAVRFLLNKKTLLLRDFNEPNMDSFGRLLRHVFVDGVSMADTLRALGLVYE
jgi:endonuclease YncB( thermonuclease family)